MRKFVCFVLLTFSSFFSLTLDGQEANKPTKAAEPALAGRWIVSSDFFGSNLYFGMLLEQDGEKLKGNFDGDKLEGAITGSSIKFLAKDEHGGTEEGKGSLQNGIITGTVIFTNSDDPTRPETHTFSATKVPARRAGAAQRHDFTPTIFYRQFSALNKPVLTVSAGDTIHTTTVDAGGADENGVTRVLGGNPETGPFYVESAAPGDTLAVHFTRLLINRHCAISDDGIVSRVLDSDTAVQTKDHLKHVL